LVVQAILYHLGGLFSFAENPGNVALAK
jgi:hypothetical protein